MQDNIKPEMAIKCDKNAHKLVSIVILILVSAFLGLAWCFGRGVISPESMFGICGFKEKYHLPCPTCGYTTAVMRFTYGDFAGAFYTQPAAGLLCVFSVLAWCVSLLTLIGVNTGVFFSKLAQIKVRHWIVLAIIIVLSGWAVTLARALSK